jgi:integrase/recombinase XerC/integrase/recombinase XerD
MGEHTTIDLFLRALQTDRNVSARTLKAYRIDLLQFEAYCMDTSLLAVTPETIRGYVEHLLAAGRTSSTAKRKLATLKVFYKHLVQDGYAASSPLAGFQQRFRTPRRLPRVLSVPEVTLLLRSAHAMMARTTGSTAAEHFRSVRNYTILEVMFATGIRIDEVSQLSVGDIDIDRHSILIHGKGRKERLLFIYSREVCLALSEYLARRSTQVTGTDALFVGRGGARLSTHAIRVMFYDCCRRAAITKHYTPHCLRHTMATMLVENGADIRSVQDILGHSSISTTEIYVHVSERRKKDVLRSFNQRDQLQLFP